MVLTSKWGRIQPEIQIWWLWSFIQTYLAVPSGAGGTKSSAQDDFWPDIANWTSSLSLSIILSVSLIKPAPYEQAFFYNKAVLPAAPLLPLVDVEECRGRVICRWEYWIGILPSHCDYCTVETSKISQYCPKLTRAEVHQMFAISVSLHRFSR